jgi:hypothetical protein
MERDPSALVGGDSTIDVLLARDAIVHSKTEDFKKR